MSGDAEHEIYRRRRHRNLTVMAILFGMVALLFTVTIVKLRENAVNPFYEMFNPRGQK